MVFGHHDDHKGHQLLYDSRFCRLNTGAENSSACGLNRVMFPGIYENDGQKTPRQVHK